MSRAKFRMVHTSFWSDGKVSEEMTPEDKFFMLYLLTNENTTQTGIYQITKKKMAFDMGYSIETINALMDRFINYHKIIVYNVETRELAIKKWGKYNLNRGGRPVEDCIKSELKNVSDLTLIELVSKSIESPSIKGLYDSFTSRGQEKEEEKEEYKEKEKDKTVQQVEQPSIDDQFETWWKHYPKKMDKKAAFSKFKTAIKNHSFEVLMNGLLEYNKYIRFKRFEKEFIKNATTFLNQESFLNNYSELMQYKPRYQNKGHQPYIAPQQEYVEQEREIIQLADDDLPF